MLNVRFSMFILQETLFGALYISAVKQKGCTGIGVRLLATVGQVILTQTVSI